MASGRRRELDAVVVGLDWAMQAGRTAEPLGMGAGERGEQTWGNERWGEEICGARMCIWL